jgi:hypothetical protein
VQALERDPAEKAETTVRTGGRAVPLGSWPDRFSTAT